MATPDKPNTAGSGGLGAGSEAAAGIHAANTGSTQAPGTDEAENADQRTAGGKGTGRSGSEPLGHDREHKGGYGGEGGEPRTSSDTREPPNPSPS